MTIDTKELRRLAQAATPGRWYVEGGNYIYGCKEVIDGEEEWHPVIACTDDDEVSVNFAGNAKFVAAANPVVVSELLDRIEVAEKDIALKERIIDSLGVELNAVAKERDTLRAKIAEMKNQEPVAFQWELKAGQYTYVDKPEHASKNARIIPLYALPGAKGE